MFVEIGHEKYTHENLKNDAATNDLLAPGLSRMFPWRRGFRAFVKNTD